MICKPRLCTITAPGRDDASHKDLPLPYTVAGVETISAVTRDSFPYEDCGLVMPRGVTLTNVPVVVSYRSKIECADAFNFEPVENQTRVDMNQASV